MDAINSEILHFAKNSILVKLTRVQKYDVLFKQIRKKVNAKDS